MKVSVVIPTHGRADLLGKTIDSVLSQTYPEIEIIVISDGVDERTKKLVDTKYRNKIKYYYYKDSKGANYARNFGVSKSSSNYIAFLDDDDQWEITKIEEQMVYIQNNPECGLIYTGNKQIYLDSNVHYYYIPNVYGDLSKKIFEKNYIGSTSSVLIRKDIFYKAGQFDENLRAMQDYDLWIRVSQITKIGAVSKPHLLYFNDRTRNQISSSVEKYKEASEIIKAKHKAYFSEHPDLEKKFDFFILDSLINKSLRADDKKGARSLAVKQLKLEFSPKSIINFVTTFMTYDLLLKFRAKMKRG